ncbi:cache domain-containing sensor histidine kinase [Inconstantimicrobium mannanitabidum]|uniref:Histidine kinase n=1 Tax=Inconstantimicrobium mannanitabidum TaxID=1604901 RepID=A0ACB5R9B5_9CLOT|nr:sensor histidine kinase [Clostridium sp. TW13]GKX65783.1 histidine kinase [Clostridium sp. TW13]
MIFMFIRKLVKKYKSKLLNQFMFIYSILIIIPLTILFTYTYTKMSSMIEDNIITSTQQAFDQSYSYITYKLYRIFNTSNSMVIENNLTSILRKDPKNYPLNEQIGDLYSLRNILSSYENNVDIFKIHLYVNKDFIYSNEGETIYSMAQLAGSKWLSKVNGENSRYFWCPASYLGNDSDELLCLGKTIVNPDNFSENIGYLIINFKKSDLEGIISKINSIDGSLSCIVNDKGDLIASSNATTYKKYKDVVNKIKPNGDTTLSKINIHNNSLFVQSANINKTDWRIINIVPYSEVSSKINTQRIVLIIIVIIFGGASLAVGFYFFNSINKRLSKVIKGMRELHTDTLDNFIENDSDDELGELINNYNYMLAKMSILVEEQYKSGKAIKNAELKALQSQINPHFLYNTLDMINWMSYKNMNSEISLAVKSLAKFYKLSLNKGKDISSIEDEIAHVSAYVQIQNMRYSNRISLEIDVNFDTKNYNIPKITLQPIVENSINHGIFAKGEVNGKILITGSIINNDIYLKVIDDGIGIKESELPYILSPSEESNSKEFKSKGSGYGIKNINERLKLYYGENYGLSYSSIYGQGTTVTIKLPIIQEEL